MSTLRFVATAVGVVAMATISGCGSSVAPVAVASRPTVTTQTQTQTQTPSAMPTPTMASASPTELPSVEPSPPYSESSQEASSDVVTAANSKEFASLLKLGDACDDRVAAFATEYAGRTIEFDGSIAAMNNHEDYTTRYDILVGPGNKGPNTSRGPAFKFDDVNMFDLALTGDVPDSIGVGDKLHLVAQVGEFNATQCLFFLEPVYTAVR